MSSNILPFEWLEVIQESSYQTPNASPVVYPTSSYTAGYVRLAGANRFTMRKNPTKRKVGFGGGWAAPGYAVTDRSVSEGTLELELCYSQAALFLPWAINRINNAQTAPWVTTEPIGDLASCTIYHGTVRSDGTTRKRWYKGVKVTSCNITCNGESGLMMLKLGLRGSAGADPTSLATAPADGVFPTDTVLFYQASGAVLKAASALTYVEGVTIDITNGLDPRYFFGQTLTFDRLRGQTAKTELDVLMTASPEWRTLMEALTSEALSLAWTNSTVTITFDLKANNLVDSVSDDITPGRVFNQKVSYEWQYDTSAGSFTCTVV